jgi:site-specific recombinase XerD
MTIVEQARNSVNGFEAFYQKFLRKMFINDRAESTVNNYGRQLAALAIHYHCIPTALSLDQVEEYLFLIKQKYGEESDNNFKFLVCGLRFAYRMEGMNELRLSLPVIRKNKKLPVVLSKEEVAAMINIPCLLKHRVMIALLYGCGLRCGEIRNVKVMDIDFHRAVIHVRQGKGKKDRYVPLGNSLPPILKKYIALEQSSSWLFPGHRPKKGGLFFTEFKTKYGQRSVQWAIKRAALLAGISKPVNVHSLRHTYATHLLEDGINILTIKEMMGHANVRTTMLYLHVAQINNSIKCSPFDTLKGIRLLQGVQTSFEFPAQSGRLAAF